MTFTHDVQDRITLTRQAALREGDLTQPGFEAACAHQALNTLLMDEAVIREVGTEVSAELDLSFNEVKAVLMALSTVLNGGDSVGEGA